MWPFKQTQRTPQPVVDYISPGLYQSVRPWLHMLECYRKQEKRTEFEVIAYRLHDDFNLQMISWQSAGEDPSGNARTLESFPHIIERMTETWGTQDCLNYLYSLLEGNREGSRTGFPLPVFEEILLLAGMLESQISRKYSLNS